MPRQSLLQLEKPRRRSSEIPRLPLRIALVLPAQVIMLLVVAVPTLIVLWLSLTDWQPTDNIPWFKAEFAWFWNFYDLLFDERFVSAVLQNAFCRGCLLFRLNYVWRWSWRCCFLDEWPWRKIAVSVIILPMMVVPVDAANSFFMLFGDHGPVNELLSSGAPSTGSNMRGWRILTGLCCRSSWRRSGSGLR